MAISVLPFERQFLDFAKACETGAKPLMTAEDGFRALQLVSGIYDSCRSNLPVDIPAVI